ncbi:hypothetical protein C9374_007422 [Naegleria lovaniensis]|uniref:DEAD/DEAH box helicase n=1 Tax=Naegleria lovaniensis TaxID=51637 RepID=A0AA88GN14_NAELO|nr:uncharacterized protein C9374_007422 [Naegleria lovaniensis]KAG2379283.1 hypothetical protein C9374_007422 [Naegleria lovaniensis]
MTDEYDTSYREEEEEEEETTEQILESIAEEEEVEEDEELIQQSMLPSRKHQKISIETIEQIKQIVSFNQYDLIDAKGGLDLVVVNGDQLLTHFLRDSLGKTELNSSIFKLDWTNYGGQFLHLTYLVESFIKNLLDRDMRIDVVFFDDTSNDKCVKASFLLNLAHEIHKEKNIPFGYLACSFLLAKEVIIHHLSKVCERYVTSELFIVTRLNDTWYNSSSWENLLTKRKPSFIISTLALQPFGFSMDDLFCTDSVLIKHVTVAYDLCFYGNTVIGFCSAIRDAMTHSFKPKDAEIFLTKCFNEERFNEISTLFSECAIFDDAKNISEARNEISRLVEKETKGIQDEYFSKWITNACSRIELIVLALKDTLERQTLSVPNSLSLAKILTLSVLTQYVIPLKDRAQYLLENVSSPLMSFNQHVMRSIFIVLKQIPTYINLYDLIDFRLFTKVTTLLYSMGILQKLTNDRNDDEILAALLPTELQQMFKTICTCLNPQKASFSTDKHWWETAVKPLVAENPVTEGKPAHPECLLRQLLPIDNESLNKLFDDVDFILPHQSKEQSIAQVEAPKAIEQEQTDEDIEDWEKEDWLKEEPQEVVEQKEEIQENLTEDEARELRFEKSYPLREQEINYSVKKDLDQIPNDFSGPRTEWEKQKVQDAQKRLHHYSESIRSLSDKKVIETAKSAGVENTSPQIESKPSKPATKTSQKKEAAASASTSVSSATPSTKVRLMMIESNIKKREKEINEVASRYSEYIQKFSEFMNKSDELKELGPKLEPYENLIKLLLEGVFKDIRVIQNIQSTATDSSKKVASGSSDSYNAANLLQEQRMTCETVWIQLTLLRAQYMARKLLLDRQDLQNSLRRQNQPKKGVKFLSFGDEDSIPTDKKEKDEKKKSALKKDDTTATDGGSSSQIAQISNLSGGADLPLYLYWEPFEIANRIYEIVSQFVSDTYISDISVLTSPSQEKSEKASKPVKNKKPAKGDKKEKTEKVKPITKIDLKNITQSLINMLCDLGFVNFGSRLAEKFNSGDITYGSLIKDNLLQQSDSDSLPSETVKVKSDSVNDKPESAEFQLMFNSAIIESASNIEIPPPEIPETVVIDSKSHKAVKGHPKKEKSSTHKKQAEEEPVQAADDTSSVSSIAQNYVLPSAKSLGFTPDPWQEQMILSILQNKSILVSAPTSSGKTFIAFFAIEKVLRESDDAIIVYCCPTKALVNQAYAEVYSRFQKVYSNTSQYGVSSMLGMYTSEEKINVTTCQVLITVPQSLENLMTSAENLEWKRRMRYIILDEIHCINESSSSGQVWEHVLSLLECPFIALSASIGNPKEFAGWLNENYNKDIVSHVSFLNEQQKSVELVVHDERPRPLEFYNYDTATDKLTEIHPMATLNPNSIDTVLFSHMQNFSPLQCLTLYKIALSIKQSWTEQSRPVPSSVTEFLTHYNPDTFFNNFGLIRRQQFAAYGKSMKEGLINMSSEVENHEFLLEITRTLLKDVKASFDNMDVEYESQLQSKDAKDSDNISESDVVSTTSSKIISKHKFGTDGWLKDNIIPLITRLAEDKLLPSIFFSFDRPMCDFLVRKVAAHLRTARANSQLGNYFHLYSSGLEKVRSEKEIRYSLQSLEQFGSLIPIELREALEVGVAVHHHSCPSEYLTEVERLFRLRCLPIVISTSTLALGIHMPCKTVVMVGHSIYLTTTMFQQCAGRSGRRGYDVKGRVVLYGIPHVTANRLLSGVTPKIKGAMGLRSTFLLKMLSLLNKSQNEKEKLQIVTDDLSRLVNKKIFYLGQILANSEKQNKFCIRFMLDFLRRNLYLSQDASLGDFAQLNISLFHNEPANFLFIHLLQTGAIGQYLETWNEKLEQTTLRPEEKVEMLGEKLLILLNILFEPRKLSHWDISPFKLENYFGTTNFEEISSKNSTKTNLPANILSQFKDYNRILLKTYSTFVIAYCKNYAKDVLDNYLPLSEMKFPEESEYIEKLYQTSELCKALHDGKLQYYGTSSFAALSGIDDTFTHISQLVSCKNQNVILDTSLLPYLEIVERISQNASISLSSFAVEFLRNGQKRQVTTDCDFPNLSLCFNSLKNVDRILGQVLYNIYLFMNIKNGANNDLFMSTLTKVRTRFHDRVTGGRKTRKKVKQLKTINVEIDDRDLIKGSGAKLKNATKHTKKDAVTKETGSLME